MLRAVKRKDIRISLSDVSENKAIITHDDLPKRPSTQNLVELVVLFL
jgi:hypothetical protein